MIDQVGGNCKQIVGSWISIPRRLTEPSGGVPDSSRAPSSPYAHVGPRGAARAASFPGRAWHRATRGHPPGLGPDSCAPGHRRRFSPRTRANLSCQSAAKKGPNSANPGDGLEFDRVSAPYGVHRPGECAPRR